MRRICDGTDENLLMYVDPATNEKQFEFYPLNVAKPCDCGLAFDDARRTTIFPHHTI